MQQFISLVAAISPVAAVLIGWWLGRRDLHKVGGQVAEGIETTRQQVETTRKQVASNVEAARQQVAQVEKKLDSTRQQVTQKVDETKAQVLVDLATTQSNDAKLDAIHQLVNSGRSELLRRIAELTQTISKLLPGDQERADDAKRAREDARDHGVEMAGDGGAVAGE